ncbi:MAG TPA: carboxylesterase family protein [Pseudonocardia sp.]|uniref:carboxylesterase/lipase family protein n=1 Tax=Pseudonocardia sp. TaxID=60912 RepID=UPI002C1FE6DC|nr:carboxylesterase family protein [Pseudonocardia sp.]HTF50107.1 carboxylesterase family protein [Pseudonocardia sp.]
MCGTRTAVSITFAVLAVLVSACGTQPRAGAGNPGGPPDSTVRISTGELRGTVTATHRLFQGIPYAAPPVGPLRWAPPVSPAPWGGVRDATRPGAACPQQPNSEVDPGTPISEDCLFLNVWTPIDGRAHHPVLVWLPGGAFVSGRGDRYGAQRLVEAGDLVVVTINYRLGALGFLAHPALAHDGGQVGNFGLMDQQAALRWVRDNITAFGGDPHQVTIAGQSAGAMSVCDHLVSPASAGLFRAAILQSPPCEAQGTEQAAEKASISYASAHGCGQSEPAVAASCMRALPASQLLDSPAFFSLGGVQIPGPVAGGALLPLAPPQAMAQGKAARVPTLIGTNHDEFRFFLAEQFQATKQVLTPAQYPAALAAVAGPNALAHYPLSRFAGQAPIAFSAAATDGGFACITSEMAQALSAAVPVYEYEFNDTTAPVSASVAGTPFPLGAAHSLELPYLFELNGLPLNAAQQQLSRQMIDYWASFVDTQTPNAPNAPKAPVWPQRQPSGQVLSLAPGTSSTSNDFDQQHQCAFWATQRPL